MVRLSALCFRQIDALSRAKDNALPGLDIGRDRPQPQRHIERISSTSPLSGTSRAWRVAKQRRPSPRIRVPEPMVVSE
jgi:hypothetical protein